MPIQQIEFHAQDGYRLCGQLYVPEQDPAHQIPYASIVVAAATGVPQGFYRRFAEYAVLQGYQVLVFDYRGIGQSKQGSLKGFQMSFLDWARLDLAAAVDYMATMNLPLFMVGHSYGGHALGLLPNHQQLTAAYFFGTGAGWAGYMPFKERLKVEIMWNSVFPIMAKMSGYLPWSKLKMGEDLPLDVYRQWRKWCKNREYFFQDPDYAEMLKTSFSRVEIPVYFGNAIDDDWALAASRNAFVQYYSNAKMTCVDLVPADYAMKNIGHMGYFRANATQIWAQVFKTFAQFDAVTSSRDNILNASS